MIKMIRRILAISGKSRPRIYLGMVFNFLKTVSMAMMLLAVYIVVDNLDSLTPDTILTAVFVLIGSIAGRFLFQWLMDITMSAKGFDMFRDYRLEIGERLKKAPMGYFSEQRLGSIQTVLTSTIVELEQYSMLAITDLTGGMSMALVITVIFYSSATNGYSFSGGTGGRYGSFAFDTGKVGKTHPTGTCRTGKSGNSIYRGISGESRCCGFLSDRKQRGRGLRRFDRKRQAEWDQERAGAGLLKGFTAVFKITGCGMLLMASILYLTGIITLPYCLMFLVSAFLVYSEFEQMGDGAFLSKKINNELDRLEAVTDIPDIDTTMLELDTDNFDIELHEVSFAYITASSSTMFP
jgi:ATP-binding cassette subfamily B protein